MKPNAWPVKGITHFVHSKAPRCLTVPQPLCTAVTVQTPAVAIVEMMQCTAQALSIGLRKPAVGGGAAKAGAAEAQAALLQLPHFDLDVIKKLKKRKVQSIKGGCLK